MSYQVEFSHEAAKELQRLDRITNSRIKARLEQLSQDPLSSRLSRQMETAKDRRYSRVGDWRIIYRVEEERKIIYVAAIRPRSGAYR